eukprot:Skav222099  [mRNA]  locus=scaffold2165:324880:328409:- [translate_table: standard]
MIVMATWVPTPRPARKISGARMKVDCMRFCYVHVEDIWWKTILVLLLANLGNAYYLATIFIKVYLIDTVLNVKDETSADRLWIHGDRNSTAVCHWIGRARRVPRVA